MEYTIGQISKITGLSEYTIRFYEKEKLIPNIKRNKNGIRIFSEEDLNWVNIVKCFRDTNMSIDDIKNVDMLILPGGMPGATNLRDDSRVINLIKNLLENNKKVAAICAAPIVLEKASVIDGECVTSYPGFENELKGANYKEDLVVVSGNIITSRGPATALEFAYTILKELGSDKAEILREEMLYNLLK